jgi:hypothetical protein
MRPSALEIVAGDFAFAPGHRRIPISRLTDAPNSAAAFSIAEDGLVRRFDASHTSLLAIL